MLAPLHFWFFLCTMSQSESLFKLLKLSQVYSNISCNFLVIGLMIGGKSCLSPSLKHQAPGFGGVTFSLFMPFHK